jgi:hypothetical protein
MFWDSNKKKPYNKLGMQPCPTGHVFGLNCNNMKKLLIIMLIGFINTATAQQSESRSVGSFAGIKVSEGIDVFLKKAGKEALRVEVTGVKLSEVITEVSGDYLKIHLKDGEYPNGRTVKVYVSYVQLTKLSASSAANIFADGVIKVNQLSLSASSAATIDIELDADKLEVSASSAADLELRGKANTLEIDVSSAGEVDAYDLMAESVEVEVSSAGSAKVNAVKEINADASSGGSIRYKGNPERSNINSSSGGSVKKSN